MGSWSRDLGFGIPQFYALKYAVYYQHLGLGGGFMLAVNF